MIKSKSGFTIVELLIVIVVVGILATITIVGYKGVQNRARVATVQSDFTSTSKVTEVYRSFSSTGSYPTIAAELTAAGVTLTKSTYNAAVWCYDPSGTSWALVVDAKDGKSYYYNSVTRAFAEFTANKVQGNSGGPTCLASNGGSNWQWLLQTPTSTWAI